MNRYTFMEMDGALAERLNEILLELPKKAPYKERRAEAGVFFRAKEKIGFAGKNQPEQALVAGVKPVGEKLVHLRSLLTGRSPRSGRSRGWRSWRAWGWNNRAGPAGGRFRTAE